MVDRLLPPGATESWLEHGEGRIRVLRGGPGQHDDQLDALPVLLIHGGGYDNAAISWSKVFGPLSADRAGDRSRSAGIRLHRRDPGDREGR